MESNQQRIIELLREVHALVVKAITGLNLQIAELSSRQIPSKQPHPLVTDRPGVKSSRQPVPSPFQPQVRDLWNEQEVAENIKISVGTLRRWRVLRTGPKFLKIGAAVRYRRAEIDTWLNSCSASS